MMKEAARGIYTEAQAESDTKKREQLGKWALASEGYHYQKNALLSAQSIPSISLKGDEFDRDPWLMNLQNGMIDLRTGNFLPHDHRRLCTKTAGVEYQESATCPHWDEFLNKIFRGNPELVAFLQRGVGYSLTGSVDAQKIFFGHGQGANGKSTFFEILKMLFGDYYQAAPSEMIMHQKTDPIPIDKARLRGARMVVLSEIEQGRRLAETKTKQLTGGDTVTARHLFHESFSFAPTFKFWLHGNHRPVIYGTDWAVWRRILLIPFQVIIPEEEQREQSEILKEMRKDLPGILNWALVGLAEYRKQGLKNVPVCVRSATEEYRQDSDTVGQFLDECCTIPGQSSTKDLHEAFKEWGGQIGQRAFTEAVREKGFKLKAGKANRKFWVNLGIKADDGLLGLSS
jgi:putative DNA primase/helicase